jgi:hypothetical protein
MSDRKAKTTGAETDACPASSKEVSGEHWRWCPQCGHELIDEKCKLRCPRCHYFISCPDFDFAGQQPVEEAAAGVRRR